MSKEVKTRIPEQCKSHHAKMVLKFNGSIEKIIEYHPIENYR